MDTENTTPAPDTTPDQNTQAPPAAEPVQPAETPEPTPSPEPAPTMARLIEEAELRGYIRGRNATAAELMRSPAMLQNPLLPYPDPKPSTPSAADSFLASITPDVW